jgi:hypothetical protein
MIFRGRVFCSETLAEPFPNPSETDPLYSDQDQDSNSDQELKNSEIYLPENAETPEKRGH